MSTADRSAAYTRSTLSEIEVPGDPDTVWHAIATAQGTAGWLFPTEIEARVGGVATIDRGPYGGVVPATVTAWRPPCHLAYAEVLPQPDGSAGPLLATELLVEARGGGTCIVRVVSGLHSDSTGWEDLIDGAGEGWDMALVSLRAYLEHFGGRPATAADATVSLGPSVATRQQAAVLLFDLLGLTGRRPGERYESPDGAPRLAGVVEHVGADVVLLRTTDPAPGLVQISSFPADGEPALSVNVSYRLVDDDGAREAPRARDEWSEWLSTHARELTPIT